MSYRYTLTRRLGPGNRRCLFVMLNPSIADQKLNDPTIRRCMGFARRWGYSDLEVVNLWGLRATDPTMLKYHPNPMGHGNQQAITEALQRADLVVAAWGVHGAWKNRGIECLASHANVTWYCLGTTKYGHPRHPLYVKSTQPPVYFAGPR